MHEPEKFRQFEHTGWQEIPARYHRGFGHLTAQTIGPLLDAVGARDGVKLLDIACGPGYAAAAACRRGAQVVGIDFSAAMIAQARTLHPGIDLREGDAENPAFPAGSFDAAVMNFGVLHLARPERALTEAFRVLRPGGRFAFTAWANPEKSIGFGIVLKAVEAHGDLNVALPVGPPFFRFSDPQECTRSLRQAGFETSNLTEIGLVWRLPSIDSLFEIMHEATVRTAGILRLQKPEVLERIRSSMRRELKAYRKGQGLELPMAAVLAVGRKPEPVFVDSG